jgi:hypothetical protein
VSRVWQRVGTVGVFLALLVVAGCGGGSTSPEESWAGDACGTVDTWKGEVESIGDDLAETLRSPSLQTVATIQTSVDRAQQATRTLASDLEALGPPPGDHGTEARDIVDGLVESLRLTLTTVRTQIESLSDGASLSELTTALSVVSAQVSGAVAQVQSAVEELGSLAGELGDAFEQADACDQLAK